MPRSSRSLTLQRILFDPLSYIHPYRLRLPPHLTAQPAARAAANELILAAFRLNSDCNEAELDAQARQCLQQWARLPQVAYLIGCHALRAELAWQGRLLQLPAWAQIFTTIDLPTNSGQQRICANHETLLSTGYAQLQAWRRRLPAPLAQRLQLLFPPQVDKVASHAAASPLILTLALQHAQRNPFPPPTASA